jgi:hypothetical protein
MLGLHGDDAQRPAQFVFTTANWAGGRAVAFVISGAQPWWTAACYCDPQGDLGARPRPSSVHISDRSFGTCAT